MSATADANDRMVREFLAAWERRDTEHIVERFAPDGVYHSIPLTPIVGRAAIRDFVAGFEGRPPGHLVVHHQIATDTVVMNERTDDITLNGRPVSLRIMGVFEIAGGHITAWREYFDLTPVRAAYESGKPAPALDLDRLLDDARRHLDRVTPDGLAGEMAGGALVVDIRPLEQRQRDGVLPGAVVVDRNVLEWRLAPSSEWRLDEATGDTSQRVIVVCNEGYSSSLAARTLQLLGLSRATDLDGGFEAWRAMSAAE